MKIRGEKQKKNGTPKSDNLNVYIYNHLNTWIKRQISPYLHFWKDGVDIIFPIPPIKYK